MTHRPFTPGESYYAAVFDENGTFVRRDYSLEAWKKNPPEHVVGFWKKKVPEHADAGRTRLAVNDVLLSLLDYLLQSGDQPDKLYILALLLARRRVFRIENNRFDETGMLELYNPKRDETLSIPVVLPTPQRREEIQDELELTLHGEPTETFTFPFVESGEEDEPLDLTELELPDMEDLEET
ncbi:MAG: hypothetical protein Q4D98_01090 [Planctomycetia bacterium]|nr:hypothetical protein [Planctomycetia bacterium]